MCIALTIDTFEFAKKMLITVQIIAALSKRYESLFIGKSYASRAFCGDAVAAGDAGGCGKLSATGND